MEEMDHMNLHKVSMCPRTLLPNIEALARNVSDRPLVRSRSRRNLVEEKNTNKHGESPPEALISITFEVVEIFVE